MTIQIPSINIEKGLDLYDGDEDIYLQVLQSYASNTPAVLDKLRNVTAETLADYVANVHGVKSTSANIGAEDVRETAKQLEAMAKAGDLDGVLAQNTAFLKTADQLLSDIQDWLRQNNS